MYLLNLHTFFFFFYSNFWLMIRTVYFSFWQNVFITLTICFVETDPIRFVNMTEVLLSRAKIYVCEQLFEQLIFHQFFSRISLTRTIFEVLLIFQIRDLVTAFWVDFVHVRPKSVLGIPFNDRKQLAWRGMSIPI